ncbi:MAG: DNA-protecting protein DprA [Rhodobacteraceae bacterium]|nr:DNA-protecting protein DprA [Paracoccaceae bacterium]
MQHTLSSSSFGDSDRVDWIQLIRSRRVGPQTFFRLLGQHGTAAAALDALPGVARDAGVTSYQIYSRSQASDEYWRGRDMGCRLIAAPDPDYPPLLRGIAGAPPVLWALGDVGLLARPSVVIVGARNASALGKRFTGQLCRALGEAGLVVVSGLARGIDTAAHESALEHGTIGVQAGGIDVIYPLENAALHRDIAEGGLRLSEQPLGLVPQARHFPQRNRIIAGLAEATLVIEGATRSGSLITAREAGDLGREVMAVPGNPLDQRAAGCNALIREGATLIRSAEDVLVALPARDAVPAPEPDRPVREVPPAARLEPQVLSLLSVTGVSEDALIRDLGAPAAAVTTVLTRLELEGKIERQPGGLLALAV